jgi:paraquat-inducible protein B
MRVDGAAAGADVQARSLQTMVVGALMWDRAMCGRAFADMHDVTAIIEAQ